jgi:transposase InsO family protein
LELFQIDHTPIDVILVDEIDRRPIGRPWLTLVSDVATRMIAGYYLSFDHPSSTSVALALSHAVLPKEKYLGHLGVVAEWPVSSLPERPAARTATPAAAGSALIGCISNRLLDHAAAIARASFFAIVSIRVDRPSVYPARSVCSTGNAASLSSLASRAPARLFSECQPFGLFRFVFV